MNEKILVVDDSGMSRRVLRRILESESYTVVEAADGMAALELFYLEKPALVMLDMVMKGMYGLEVLERLRSINPDVVVLVATADIQSTTREMVEAAGAAGMVTKPFSSGSVLPAVKSALKKGGVEHVAHRTAK